MKRRVRFGLAGWSGSVALGLMAPSLCAAEDAPPAAAETESAGIVRGAFVAFVRDSIVPADPRVVAVAALEALAPGREVSLPATFGSDVTADANWLAAQAANANPVWPVVDAMARSARIVHLGLSTPERRAGMRALGGGDPLCTPGFSVYALADGRLAVRDVVPGASAATSGLRAGDVLAEVDGQPTVRVDPFFLNLLPAGTDVPVKIIRDGAAADVVLHMIRSDVSPIEARLLDDDAAWILVRWFAQSANPEHDTAALFRHHVQALLDRGARGLVLDLRSALGGSGEVNMASALCDGEIIYSVRLPLDAPVRPVPRDGARIWPEFPIVVLQNGVTTSAGEALTLALRELGHAVVVGETSGGGLTEFGFVKLAEGYGVIIPQGVVLGPLSGQCPPGYAIQPDIEVSNPGIDELLAGRDRQLDAARAALARN